MGRRGPPFTGGSARASRKGRQFPESVFTAGWTPGSCPGESFTVVR